MFSPKKRKVVWTLAVLVAGYFSVAAGRFLVLSPAAENGPAGSGPLRAKGNPTAPFWIIEYIDFQCASCGRASLLLHDTMEKYPEKIYLQVRFRPLPNHLHGLRSAVYAECASRQGKFWDFYEIIFGKQPDWVNLEEVEPLFRTYADLAGLDRKELDACLADPTVEKKVQAEGEEAERHGIKATPSIYVNGKLIVGYKDFEQWMTETFKDT